jgi:two-component system KDP operon response regulator KdpE
VVDVGLVTDDGLGAGAAQVEEGVARARAQTSAPILVVLPRGDESEQTAALDGGADDFLVRPLEMPHLLARLRVWMRHSSCLRGSRTPAESSLGRVRLDSGRRTLLVEGRAVHITPIERRLVIALAKRQEEGMTESQAMAAVWQDRAPPQPRYLRALVRQLRLKIERDPGRPEHLVSTTEGGYRLHLG